MTQDGFENLGRHSGFDCAGCKGVAEDMGRYSFKIVTVFVDLADYAVDFILDGISSERVSVSVFKNIFIQFAFRDFFGTEKGSQICGKGNIAHGRAGFWHIFEISPAVDIFQSSADVYYVFAEINIGIFKAAYFSASKPGAKHYGKEIIKAAVF